MALFSIGPSDVVGEAWRFSNNREISAEFLNTDHCVPGDVVLSGYDRGVISLSNLRGATSGRARNVQFSRRARRRAMGQFCWTVEEDRETMDSTEVRSSDGPSLLALPTVDPVSP